MNNNNNKSHTNNQNDHTLQNTWVIWEYGSTCINIGHKDFWRLWTQLPRPSDVLCDGYNIRRDISSLGRKIDAFSVFKKGIRPE